MHSPVFSAGATTTTAGETTSTTEAATTTTAGTIEPLPITVTTAAESGVLGIQVSAPQASRALQTQQATAQQTLPFTGVSSSSLALFASAIAGVGLLLLLASRQGEEKSPVRRQW